MWRQIAELIKGGFLSQTILVIVVWGTIAFLAINRADIPDPLLDAGFVIIGFYFRSAVEETKKIRRK